MKRSPYKVTVRETNEIAGEVFTSDAVAYTCRLLSQAREWAEKKWGGHPPADAKIIDEQGNTYDIPSQGKPLIDIL